MILIIIPALVFADTTRGREAPRGNVEKVDISSEAVNATRKNPCGLFSLKVMLSLLLCFKRSLTHIEHV